MSKRISYPQMDVVTQSNAAQVEELSSTSQSLASQGDHLKALVSHFTLNADTASQIVKPEKQKSPATKTPLPKLEREQFPPNPLLSPEPTKFVTSGGRGV